jgi:hypothetical protein
MKFSPEIEAFIKDYVIDLAEGNVAIFAGAGLSKSVGFVDWPELLSDIAEELGLKSQIEHDLISLAQFHVNERGGRDGLIRKILQEFSEQAEASASHRIIARLPIPTYWTTNYDTLIEDALQAIPRVVDMKHQVRQLLTAKPKRDATVYKMHGDVNHATDAVITKEQYETYHRTHEPFITALSVDLASKTFLFLGFSFTDPNLDYVLSRLSQVFAGAGKQHYCFVKEQAAADDPDGYKKRRQQLRINDLKRYKIRALMIDNYEEIPLILSEIEARFKKRTVFISGSAEEYGNWNRTEAQALIHSLTKKLIQENLRVVNGFGWGVGSAVINGALDAVYEQPNRFSEAQLIMRPFPQFSTGGKSLPEMWQSYRERMISLAGIAIFIFGNKIDAGAVVNAAGVKKEFEICLEQGVIPIPVPSTGFMAAELFGEVIANSAETYKGLEWIIPELEAIAAAGNDAPKIISRIAGIVKQINK